MAELLDFRDGIEIVDDDYPLDDAPQPRGKPSFMDYNGQNKPRDFEDIQESMEDDFESELPDVSVTKKDLQAMIERNLKQNCGKRFKSAPPRVAERLEKNLERHAEKHPASAGAGTDKRASSADSGAIERSQHVIASKLNAGELWDVVK